jgi:hypothetical protein
MSRQDAGFEVEGAEEEQSANGGRKYAPFSHSFTDPWKDVELEFTFRFAKPGVLAVKQLQKTAGRDSARASRNLIVNQIHPDDKEAFFAAAEEYPGLITSFATAMAKAVGIGDLGN